MKPKKVEAFTSLTPSEIQEIAEKQASYLATLKAEVLKKGFTEEQSQELLVAVLACCGSGGWID